jgi:hypothetical protein
MSPNNDNLALESMTAAEDAKNHESSGDTVRTTPIRNPINIESLTSWIVNQGELHTLIFGNDGRSDEQDGHWLKERMQVKQFGKLEIPASYLLPYYFPDS